MFVALSIIGSIIGMIIGALIFPMRFLDGRCSLSSIKETLSTTDPNADHI